MIKMEIDTGASVSLMSSKFFDAHFYQLAVKGSKLKIRTVSVSIVIANSKSDFIPLLRRSWLDVLLSHWSQNLQNCNIIISEVTDSTVSNIVNNFRE